MINAGIALTVPRDTTPPSDVVAPSLGLFEQPLGGGFSCATWDYFQQLAPGDIDYAGRPCLAVELAPPPQQGPVR